MSKGMEIAPNPVVCPRCGAWIAVESAGCFVCGTTRTGGILRAPLPAAIATARPAIADRPGAVLALVFGAMMFLGIPLIWNCKGFSPSAKVFWTVVALVYSAVIFWGFYLVMRWCYSNIYGV